MNRAERRRLERAGQKVPKEPVINVKSSDIKAIKNQAVNDAVGKAFILMLAIPVMVLHDKYSQLTRLTVDGKSRAERFTDMCLDLYDSFDQGYVSLDDLKQVLAEEAGVRFDR